MPKKQPLFSGLLVMAVLCVGKPADAQTDPKLHPGESHQVTGIQITNRTKDTDGDSTLDVQVSYIGKGGNIETLLFTKVKFSKTDSLLNGRVKDEEGRWNSVSSKEIKRILLSMVQNPPDYLYYIDGQIVEKQSIRKLNIDDIKTFNIMHGDEAIAKYGEKAREGVVLLTTQQKR